MSFDYLQMGAGKKSSAKAPPPPEEMANLPDRLKRAMRDRGLDQVRLAKKSGVSQGTVSKLTRGESLDGVTASIVARVAIALEVPSGWLLTGEGDLIPSVVARARRGEVPVLEEGRDSLVPASNRVRAPDERHEQPR